MTEAQLIYDGRELVPYFKRLVEEAVYHQHVNISDMSQFYIVNLLNEFSKTERLFEGSEGNYNEPPLAILLARALCSDAVTRIKLLKKMGDVSLYIAGYFSDHIDPKLVDIDYYIGMGEGAYENLSGIFAGEKTFNLLYNELSEKFIDLTGILTEVRVLGGPLSNLDIIRLYEKWLKTGDPHIKEMLEQEGIVTTSK